MTDTLSPSSSFAYCPECKKELPIDVDERGVFVDGYLPDESDADGMVWFLFHESDKGECDGVVLTMPWL